MASNLQNSCFAESFSDSQDVHFSGMSASTTDSLPERSPSKYWTVILASPQIRIEPKQPCQVQRHDLEFGLLGTGGQSWT